MISIKIHGRYRIDGKEFQYRTDEKGQMEFRSIDKSINVFADIRPWEVLDKIPERAEIIFS
jgi:tRNA(Ser,Leu) C12 N-acetylase TAN1